jgi:uncharacterized lipoprotein YmbA
MKFRLGLVLGVGLLLAGLACLGPTTPVVFHTLRAISPPGTLSRPGLAVEVMPVHLPEMLQRPQLVLSRDLGGLELASGQRWGNPLDQDLQRVLVADLALLLGSDRIVAYPDGPLVQAVYRVAVDVSRCDGRPGGTLNLEAIWTITRPGQAVALVRVRTTLTEPVPGLEPTALVAAHERVLARLSEVIGARLKGLLQEPST